MAFGKVYTEQAPALAVPLGYWLAALCGGAALMGWIAAHADPVWHAAWGTPAVLAAVHLFTLGWMTPMMLGSLTQWLPVVTNRPGMGHGRGSEGAKVATAAYLLGVGLLVAGMARWDFAWAAVGGSLLAVAVGWHLALHSRQLFTARPFPVPLGFVAAGQASLGVAVGLGLGMALGLARGRPVSWTTVGTHLTAGLGGWFLLTLIGVSYKLFPMFSPSRREPRWGWLVLAWTLLVLLLTVGWVVARGGWPRWWLCTWWGPWGLYAADLFATWRQRRSHRLDPAVLAMLAAVASLLAVPALKLAGSPLAAAWLFAFGGLGLASLAYFSKILPFALWHHRFRQRPGPGLLVPHVADILPPKTVWPTLVGWTGGVAVAVLGAWWRQRWAWEIGLGCQGLALGHGLLQAFWAIGRSRPRPAQTGNTGIERRLGTTERSGTTHGR
ncbi:MAG: hypothetical protein K6U14_06295 [Firmicutes bacterium]|nr:hypothetical protein [Alicyclobacillaceae bacterium]MCL6497230.1 hypothetical protein [Bacillota bacterium]